LAILPTVLGNIFTRGRPWKNRSNLWGIIREYEYITYLPKYKVYKNYILIYKNIN